MMEQQISLKMTNGQLLRNLTSYCPYLAPQDIFIAGVLYKDNGCPAVNLLFDKKETIFTLKCSDCRFRLRNEDGIWSDLFDITQLCCAGNKITGFQICPVFHNNDVDLRYISDCMIELFSIDSGIKPNLYHDRITQILNAYVNVLDEYVCDDWLMVIHAVRLASEIRKENGSLYFKLINSLNSKLINT